MVGNNRVVHVRPQRSPSSSATNAQLSTSNHLTTRNHTKMSKASLSSNPLPTLSSLADPPQKYIDASAMDYFLIEAVNTIRASSLVASTRAKKVEKEMIDAGLLPPPPAPGATAKDLNRVKESGSASGITNAGKADEEEEGLRVRLEAIGIHVGSNFTERFVPSS